MTNILLVGAGGFIGSVLRYLIGGTIQQYAKSFPLGTLAVNVMVVLSLVCLLKSGEFRGLFSDASRAFIFIGILGGFTTFSAFGNETINLIRDDRINECSYKYWRRT